MSILILVFAIAIVSCDGRDRVYKKSQDVFKLEGKTNSKKIIYIPEAYTETKTDTITNTDFNVHIKYYSLMNSSVELSKKELHRNFESQIIIYKKEKIIFNETINKSDFINSNESQFWDNAIMQFVWLDEEQSNQSQVVINYSFLLPKTNTFQSFTLQIDEKGNRKIRRIETS
ncbi:MAG: hypothetical protein IMY67_11770 [Bacteroidetes bacterium]|nr:hypothetical protein [Bacteroidota bacterium]